MEELRKQDADNSNKILNEFKATTETSEKKAKEVSDGLAKLFKDARDKEKAIQDAKTAADKSFLS
jgi:hypothetical protein